MQIFSVQAVCRSHRIETASSKIRRGKSESTAFKGRGGSNTHHRGIWKCVGTVIVSMMDGGTIFSRSGSVVLNILLCWRQTHTVKNYPVRLDFEHMIKARAHKGGVRIGKTPKKLASICCP
jgi:hypothetical protein